MKPTVAATYERARRLANLSIWAVHLQCRRLNTSEPEDTDFVLRRWYDFAFLIVALTRLRRAANLVSKIPEIRQVILPALREFNSAVPNLKKLRDVAEHIDEYALDEGRDISICRQQLEVSSISFDGPTLEWLGHKLNAQEALQASQNLFRAIQEASAVFKPRA